MTVSITRFHLASGLFLTPILITLLTGCGGMVTSLPSDPEKLAGTALHGTVHGGQQPVVGAQIELFAAGSTGNGEGAIALLTDTTVTSDKYGDWSVTGDYKCPSDSSEIYVMALGGNPGLEPGTNNSAITLVAPMGQCVNLNAGTMVTINEVTTVAAAYALAGFVTTNEIIGSTVSNSIGLQNAFATVNNLVDITTGTAYRTVPGGSGVAPQNEVNSLADALSACVNSTGDESVPCTYLFNNTTDVLGNYPTDVFAAAINLAHNPTEASDPLTSLSTPQAPFLPKLDGEPSDWSIGIIYYGGGMNYPTNIAIDGLGNVWISSWAVLNGYEGSGLFELSPVGVPISPYDNDIGFGGFDLGDVGSGPIAIDSHNNVWMPNTQVDPPSQGGGFVEVANDGTVLSPDFPTGDTVNIGFAEYSLSGPTSIAIDDLDNVWIGNSTGVLNEVNSAGNLISPAGDPTGFSVSGYAISTSPAAGAAGIAMDRAYRLWVTNAGQDSLVEMSQDGVILTPPAGLSGGGLDDVTGGSNPPSAVALDVFGNLVTLNTYTGTMNIFAESTREALEGEPDTGYSLGDNVVPVGIFIDSGDKYYITQSGSNSIEVVDGVNPENGAVNYFNNSLVNGPIGIAGDASGNLWIANENSGFDGSVVELVGISSPTVTPLVKAAGVVAFEP